MEHVPPEGAKSDLSDLIHVVPYSDGWPQRFQHWGRTLRSVMGDAAVRIDHIGSTSIPGLAAKPIIDMQISVHSFEPIDSIERALAHAGLQWRADNPDLTKRYFRELPGQVRTHLHVRRAGSWSEQLSLLFRDYMRCHPEDREAYARLKMQLAESYRQDRAGYVEAKHPFIWQVMQKADRWSQQTGWLPGESDA